MSLFYTLPYVIKLVLLLVHFQLNRFDYNSIFEGKINKMIEYKDHLNIRPYMSDTQVW